MILEKIVQQKIKALRAEKMKVPLDELIPRLNEKNSIIDFNRAIKKKKGLSIVAEIKKASPSKGIIRKEFNPIEISEIYQDSGVDAISILTEKYFFHGDDRYLYKIGEKSNVPLLRKDFIIDPYQIYQSRTFGAHAILLIVALLDKKKLSYFKSLAEDIGLQCLVEVHDEEELKMALEVDSKIIGINNRNLKNFKTDLKTTERLIDKIPKDKTIISESGINSRSDMIYLENLGIDGALIGEAIMREKCIKSKIKELRGCEFDQD